MRLLPDDILEMKKPHPCGSREMRLVRAGVDMKLVCCGCGHEIFVSRDKGERSVKKVKRNGEYIVP